MSAEIIMSLLSGVAAVVGVAAGFAMIKHKSEAERRFLAVLASEAAARHLRKLRNEIMHDGVTTSAELQQLIASLECFSNTLPAEHRRLIEQGLRQRSTLGRARYVAKLMNKAGIGAGPLPVAVP